MTQQDYTAQQAAAYLCLSRRSITYYIGRGRLIPDYTIGKSYMFTPTTLNTFKTTMKSAGRPRKDRNEKITSDN